MRDAVKHGVAPPPARYGAGAVTFHWTVAALIVFLGGLGLLFDDIPSAARPFWINVHVCVGLIYFALVIARVLWRTTHKAPDLGADIGEFSRRTSFAVHHLLYVLMLLIPVVGVVARVWHGRGFRLWRLSVGFRRRLGPRRLSSSGEDSPTVGLRPVRPRRPARRGRSLPSVRPTRRDSAADDARRDRLNVTSVAARRMRPWLGSSEHVVERKRRREASGAAMRRGAHQ